MEKLLAISSILRSKPKKKLWRMHASVVILLMIGFLVGPGLQEVQADVLDMVLGFEALSGQYSLVPNGYGGLDWNKFYLQTDPAVAYSNPNSALGSWLYGGGYPAFSNSTSFNLTSFRITSPKGPLTMFYEAYNSSGVRVYKSGWLYPNQYGHIKPSPGLTDIVRVDFVRMGGADYFVLDDVTYSPRATDPAYTIQDNFHHGATLQDQGYIIASLNPTGLAEILDDPQQAGNGLLRLYDSATGAVSVGATKHVSVPLPELILEFDYRFLTEGKLNIKLDGILVDTISAPLSGDGSPGSPNMANYNKTIDIIGVGITPGELDLTFELVNQGDPELHLDNLQVTNVPEPASLSLLAIGGLALIRRRKKN